MRETADVVVVGGGVIGASIAMNLALKGAGRIILCEKQTIASGPTGRSSALLRRHYSIELYARMAARSLEIYRDFENLTGLSADIVACGMLTLVGPEDYAAMQTTVGMLRRIGADAEALGVDDLRRMLPIMNTDGVAGAGYDETTGYADPVAVTNGYVSKGRQLGVEIRQRTLVTALKLSGERVTGVETERGSIDAGKVVNAAGVWADRVARMAGIELPITASRVQLASFRVPHGTPQPRVIVGDNISRCYFRPEGSDLMLVGMRSQPGELSKADPESFQERIDPERIVKAGELICGRFPVMEHGDSMGGYASMYDMSPDGHFIIESVPERPGLITAAGFSGHGFKHSPVIGQIVAELVCEGKVEDWDIEPFSSRRFASGPPLRGIYKGFAF